MGEAQVDFGRALMVIADVEHKLLAYFYSATLAWFCSALDIDGIQNRKTTPEPKRRLF